jgi:hypothetical protein
MVARHFLMICHIGYQKWKEGAALFLFLYVLEGFNLAWENI